MQVACASPVLVPHAPLALLRARSAVRSSPAPPQRVVSRAVRLSVTMSGVQPAVIVGGGRVGNALFNLGDGSDTVSIARKIVST